jgi:hypothetical protein
MFLTNFKALLVVLVLAALVFHWAKPYCLRFMTQDDFIRRRQVWMLVSCFAFLSPNFWVFALFAAPVLIWARRDDSNPSALFVLALTAAPPTTLAIPTIGIGSLFDLSLPRILALTVLLPAAVALWGQRQNRSPLLAVIDYCVAGFVIVQLVVLLPYDSVTNILRRGLHYVLDYVIVYYVFSRALGKQSLIYETAVMFCLGCAIAAPIAAFESARSWLLYQGIGEVWGNADSFAWLFRGSQLRAQAAAGHSLTFGYYMAIGFGLSLIVLRTFKSRKLSIGVAAWMWMGMIAAYSRAPWLAAVLFAVVAAVLLPRATANLKRLVSVAVVGSAIVLLSPLGETVIDSLPFVGSVDAENVTYRQQLAATSWMLIQRNPWFGDPLVLRDMEQLRQGQGIIDLVNSYAAVALFNGFVGLTLFVLPLLLGCYGAYAVRKKTPHMAESDTALGAGLIAAMCASLLYIATSGYPWLLYALLGLLVAYIATDRTEVVVQPMPLKGSTLTQPRRDALPAPTRWSR